MLAKLMKYEIKSTARVFLPLYGALLIISIISRLFINFNLQMPSAISIVVSNIIIVAICVITLVLTIQRFYKNLLGNEGYLMFTLPVKTDSIILSKMLISALWFIISGIVVMISIMIMVGAQINFTDFFMQLGLLYEKAKISPLNINLYITEFIVFMLLLLFAGILMIYACMALSLIVNKQRVLFSFGMFIAINIILEILGTMFLFTARTGGLETMLRGMGEIAIVHTGLISIILVNIILGSVFYLVTKYMLKNKLNLE